MAGYAQIAADYRQKIKDGELSPGDPFPTSREVSAEYGVAGTTVNRAFTVLKREGWIKTRPGAGTVVAHRPEAASTGLARLDRVERTGRALGHGESVAWRDVRDVSCVDREICSFLDIEIYDEVTLRTSLFAQDGQPSRLGSAVYGVAAKYVVPEMGTDQEGVTKKWRERHKERTGREVKATPQTFRARLAKPEELTAFDLPKNGAFAVLEITVGFFDENGPLAWWEDVHAPDAKHVASA